MRTLDEIGLGQVVAAAIVAAFCGSAGAQTCSGGPDGGMDATGNQCNEVVAADVEIDPDSPYEHMKPMSSDAAADASMSASGPPPEAAQPAPIDRAALQRVRGETDAAAATPRER